MVSQEIMFSKRLINYMKHGSSRTILIVLSEKRNRAHFLQKETRTGSRYLIEAIIPFTLRSPWQCCMVHGVFRSSECQLMEFWKL